MAQNPHTISLHTHTFIIHSYVQSLNYIWFIEFHNTFQMYVCKYDIHCLDYVQRKLLSYIFHKSRIIFYEMCSLCVVTASKKTSFALSTTALSAYCLVESLTWWRNKVYSAEYSWGIISQSGSALSNGVADNLAKFTMQEMCGWLTE